MQSVCQVRKSRVASFRRERVLREIVGPNAEEIHFLRQRRSKKSGRWDLDHNTQFNWPGVGLILVTEIKMCLLYEITRLADFLHVCDHREHDSTGKPIRSAQDGSNLGQEQIRPEQ